MKRSMWRKMVLVLGTGGFLLQVGGCSTVIAPLLLSLSEQVLLSLLFGGTGL